MDLKETLIDLVIVVAVAGIALGRLPRLRMNRATIALAAAAALVAIGALSFDQALAAVDGGTIVLLFAMMVIVSNLRMSGFFALVGARALRAARSPKTLLGAIIGVSGVFSALFLNDTMCIMLTPLVAEVTVRAKRDPVPYCIAVATASNVGSCATIIGNPQNMLVGASSGIAFGDFLSRLALPSILGLGVCWLVIALVFRKEFAPGERLPEAPRELAPVDRGLVLKSLGASGLLVALLLLGVPTAMAALLACATLLVSGRIEPEKLFEGVDFSLLVLFAGLFVITNAVERTMAFRYFVDAALPTMRSSLGAFAALSAAISNLVSNVPAVMLLKPLVAGFPEPERAWLALAMASTYAGNLTLLGSVANLIVAQSAKPFGVDLSFGRYFKAGLPITLITLLIGTAWLAVA